MTKNVKEERFTKDLFTMVEGVFNIKINVSASKYIDRNYVCNILEGAAGKPAGMMYEIPHHAKNLSAASGRRIRNDEAMAVVKGILGFKKENDPTQYSYDVNDIPAIKRTLYSNREKYWAMADAIKNWK